MSPICAVRSTGMDVVPYTGDIQGFLDSVLPLIGLFCHSLCSIHKSSPVDYSQGVFLLDRHRVIYT